MIIALSGGVGGAKLALGLSRVLPPEDLLVVVNTGDDFEHLGLSISPDIDTVTYTLVQRTNGRKVELPTEPKVSPDRQRLVTADFCESQCVNELAVWRVTREGVRKELAWKPSAAWSDAGATWKDAETLTIDYTLADGGKPGVVERRLSEPGWTRVGAP